MPHRGLNGVFQQVGGAGKADSRLCRLGSGFTGAGVMASAEPIVVVLGPWCGGTSAAMFDTTPPDQPGGTASLGEVLCVTAV